ncbi:phytochrome A-associated F-box protein isoform X2 [Lactuca sativa]|uniref:phytochrome A-associated F-box protein isoform X2 n=1 Tax=Lactuca sativa TaxID=4236 RepID=UPI000CD94E54|nr:phytochrome A-associated F-box protein isoform X2 [Lactuca sativa]
MSETVAENVFSYLPDDVVLNIFLKLVDDPRDWSRLACVCTKFSFLMRTICWKNKCHQMIPAVVFNLLPPDASVNSTVSPPGGWASLHKLAVCCPGLMHSGVLLENSDFGLERELGPDENFQETKLFHIDQGESEVCEEEDTKASAVVKTACDFSVCKRRKMCRSFKSHLASEGWNFSREQGNKLLASRFRGDCLYICDWPGCVHTEEKRNYMLFRGVFKNFKKSRVWRTINDGNRSKIDLNCAFCPSNEVWDLQSAFCLRPAYGFHDDGEPVVRAYVCENGHVSGAWTDWPLYT